MGWNHHLETAKPSFPLVCQAPSCSSGKPVRTGEACSGCGVSALLVESDIMEALVARIPP